MKEHTNAKEIKRDRSGIPSFQIQAFKITDPWFVGKSVEEEAKEALSILGKLLPHIVRRYIEMTNSNTINETGGSFVGGKGDGKENKQ